MKGNLLAVATGIALSLSFSATAATNISTNTTTKSATTQSMINKPADLQLWRLDCGTIRVNNLEMFSDTFNYIGESKTLTGSCYLIRHNDQLMLWDTGFPEKMLNAKFTNDPISPSLNRTLRDQLQQINIKAEDIDIVGISHYHGDHIGQAIEFPKAKLLIGADDLKVLKQTPPPSGVDAAAFAPWLTGNSEVDAVAVDRDVFGDGSVVMVNTPGHTPGSHSLLLRLPKFGPVILSGDTVHFNEQVTNNNVPSFNTDRAQSLASMNRLYGIQKDMPVTLIIQHEPEHIKLLPAFPQSVR